MLRLLQLRLRSSTGSSFRACASSSSAASWAWLEHASGDRMKLWVGRSRRTVRCTLDRWGMSYSMRIGSLLLNRATSPRVTCWVLTWSSAVIRPSRVAPMLIF